MIVLQINSVCGIGSTGRIATDLSSILINYGHDSVIAYGRGDAKSSDKTIRIGSNLDNYWHVFTTRLFDRHGLSSYNATKKFIKEIHRLNPDVIHLHNIHGYYLNIELLFNYLKESKKKVIWTLHDCWAFTGHCAYFDFIACDKWKVGCNKCPLTSEYPKSFLDRSDENYSIKKETFLGVENLHLVTPSRWLSELVKNSFLKQYPVTVINNGIDLNLFKPRESLFRKKYNLENKFILLGVASGFSERKGYSYFIKLSKFLKENEKLVLVGLSNKQLESLPKEILGIKNTNNVEELSEVYSTADVFLNLTLEDNFPTTNLEALACGTPVITFDSGGSPECIDDSSGFVVKKFDLQGLLKAIATVKENGKPYYSKYCQDLARNLYNKEVKFAEYISLYQK